MYNNNFLEKYYDFKKNFKRWKFILFIDMNRIQIFSIKLNIKYFYQLIFFKINDQLEFIKIKDF